MSATASLAVTRQSYLYKYMYKSGSKPLAPPTAKISIRRTDALLVRVDSVRMDFGGTCTLCSRLYQWIP